jgi:hypothetical protein
LVTVAVVGTSLDVTETLLDEPLKVRLVLRFAWPFTATVSVTVVVSGWGPAVKVHVAVVVPVAGIFSAPQVVPELPQYPPATLLGEVHWLPAAQAVPLNPDTVKTLP